MKSASNNVSWQNQITSNPPRGKETGCLLEAASVPVAHKVYMNTQLGVGGKVVSTFMLVESTKNFLIYLIASPWAIWYPCLDRCASFSLPRLSLEGDCQRAQGGQLKPAT